ncbi:MAG: MBL fold metallo-hydrolase, partial [Candidatus Diapherotrites archaeon]|nr:MBL fold metallo-hydrolase [Candidatus Diapherotrites archaeon]
MILEVLGAGHEVGRSSFILQTKKSRVMLDRGVKIEPDRVEYPLDFTGNIDALILSHAHLDHSGYVPNVFRSTTTNVYMTPPTLDLSKMLWEDAIKVAKLRGDEPPFGREEIKETMRRTLTFHYYQPFMVTDEIAVEFADAGHIPGAAITRLETDEGTVVYSGDFKLGHMRLHSGADLSHAEGDVLIIESTYADRDHEPREEVERKFIQRVREVLDEGGKVVIPVFALGRAQEMIDLLVSSKIPYPIYLDGMAKKATKITLRYPDYISNYHRLKKAAKKVIWVKNTQERDRITEGPAVIVTTAGMLQGGPVLHYLLKLKDDPKSAVFFTGFQTEDSPGRKLLEEGILEVDQYEFPVKLQREYFDFSAHAGRSDLFRMIEEVDPEVVVAVHGEPENVERLAKEV